MAENEKTPGVRITVITPARYEVKREPAPKEKSGGLIDGIRSFFCLMRILRNGMH